MTEKAPMSAIMNVRTFSFLFLRQSLQLLGIDPTCFDNYLQDRDHARPSSESGRPESGPNRTCSLVILWLEELTGAIILGCFLQGPSEATTAKRKAARMTGHAKTYQCFVLCPKAILR